MVFPYFPGFLGDASALTASGTESEDNYRRWVEDMQEHARCASETGPDNLRGWLVIRLSKDFGVNRSTLEII